MYTIEQATLLARQLERLATSGTHQVAGQLANLEFWLAETVHVLATIDDYPRRFRQLRDAQAAWVEAHGTRVLGRAGNAADAASSARTLHHHPRGFRLTTWMPHAAR